jgi:ABC-type proline/glycine betaine transport system permease subunit
VLLFRQTVCWLVLFFVLVPVLAVGFAFAVFAMVVHNLLGAAVE